MVPVSAHPPSTCSRLRAHAREVRARVRLAHPDAEVDLARGDPRQVAAALLLGAEAHQGRADLAVGHPVRGHRRARGQQLLGDDVALQRRGAVAAVLDGDGHAQPAAATQLLGEALVPARQPHVRARRPGARPLARRRGTRAPAPAASPPRAADRPEVGPARAGARPWTSRAHPAPSRRGGTRHTAQWPTGSAVEVGVRIPTAAMIARTDSTAATTNASCTPPAVADYRGGSRRGEPGAAHAQHADQQRHARRARELLGGSEDRAAVGVQPRLDRAQPRGEQRREDEREAHREQHVEAQARTRPGSSRRTACSTTAPGW